MNYLSFKQRNKNDKSPKSKKNQDNQNKPQNIQSLSSKFSKNNMLVAVRIRPLSKSETDDSNFNTLSVPEKDVIKITMPTEYIPDDMSGIFLAGEQIKILKVKEISYEYDFVFGEKTTQDEVYESTSANLIKQVVEGYSATIMAYGATGSGKTYTMVGKGENVGLMIRSIRYNEILKDLLSDKKVSPEIRTDPTKGVILQGAECVQVNSEKEAFRLINSGNKRRTEKQTDRNKFSSRSHAILQIYLEIQEQKSGDNLVNLNNDVSFGKFYLVDLAGSEKTSINNNFKSLTETGSINKSLLALSKCINLIVSQNKKFIPFRESKLTRILQEPLSGNGRIVLIATLSPAILNFDETMFTLQFANRAKCMKIHMKKNVVEGDKEIIDKYEEYIKNIKEEINIVENQIAEQKKNISIEQEEKEKNQEDNVDEDKIDKIKKDIVNHFKIEIDLRKKIIEEEEKIEQLKNDINNLDFQMKEKINNEYIKENELIAERRQLKNAINELNINNSGNFQIINLFHIYKYYTNYIDNISNEHRNNINSNEIKRKDNKISVLNEQLDLRDLFIDNAKKELSKNNIAFKYTNPRIETKEEIELQAYDPTKIKNDIAKYDIENNQNTIDVNLSKIKNSYLDINERFREVNKITQKVKNLNEEDNMENINQISISPLSPETDKENNNKNIFKRNVSTITKKNVLMNAGFNLLQKNNYFENRLKSNKFDSKNNNFSFRINKFNYNNNLEETGAERLENEIQKKVKTILKKDFIGRYKRSPYLKFFD